MTDGCIEFLQCVRVGINPGAEEYGLIFGCNIHGINFNIFIPEGFPVHNPQINLGVNSLVHSINLGEVTLYPH